MTARSLWFTGPRQIAVRETDIPAPAPGEVLVETDLSAISAGTEMLVYRNQFTQHLSVDASITGMDSHFSYPLTYGYACVGQVLQCGDGIDAAAWQGRYVFAFHPHASHFTASPANLIAIPDGIAPEDAIFAPNMETAVNFMQDGRPLLGERVAVLGLGVVGLLTTALLTGFPLEQVLVVDHHAKRRDAATGAGATTASDPDHMTASHEFDLVYELSGSPAALNTAIDLVGYGGRVVVGSWYGNKSAPVDLGGFFHRGRVQIISSQVSSIDPSLEGRWTKARRFDMTWEMIRRVRPSRWITQRYPVEQAAEAYQLLDTHPEDTIQVVLTYTA